MSRAASASAPPPPEPSAPPTFYVDPSAYPFRGELWCHLATDGTEQELKDFAKAIGVSPRYIQKAGTVFVHFDLSPYYRAKAVAAGAKEVAARELVGRTVGVKRASLLMKQARLKE